MFRNLLQFTHWRCTASLIGIGLCLALDADSVWSQSNDLFGSDDPFGGAEYEVTVPGGPKESKQASGELPSHTPEQTKALEGVAGYMSLEAISRTPSSVLQSESEEKKDADSSAKPDDSNSKDEDPNAESEDPNQEEVARFQSHVMRGDWVAVKEHLSELPELASPFVYSHMLTLLSTGNTILPEEIPQIADAAPAELTSQQCALLGTLLKASLVHLDEPRGLLETISKGSQRLGGSDPKKRLHAARVLMTAELFEEAEKYIDVPAKITNEISFDVLDACSLLEFTRFEKTAEVKTLESAWSFTEAAWSSTSAGEVEKQEIKPRLVKLASLQSADQIHNWVTRITNDQPQQIKHFLAAILQQAEAANLQNDNEQKASAVIASALLGNSLSQLTAEDANQWDRELRWLVVPWLNEGFRFTGNEKRLMPSGDEGEATALDQELLGQTVPSEIWLNRLPPDTAAMVRRLKGWIGASNTNWEVVQETAASLLKYSPKSAQVVVDQYVENAIKATPNIELRLEERMSSLQNQGYTPSQLAYYRNYYRQQIIDEEEDGNEGIALTRATQVHSLKKLRDLLDSIQKANLPSPSVDSLTRSFINAHSSAEVFTREDMETVFGPLNELTAESVVSLGQSMRESLAEQWRSQRVQDKAGTQRTEIELSQEVVRGYELAIEILKGACDREKKNPNLHLLAGQLTFDQAEFLYGLGARLPVYIKLRDQAFDSVRQAAKSYAVSLKQEDSKPNIDVYQRWFRMALGASDLAYLTRQTESDRPEVEKIAASIRELGQPMTDKHLEMFAAALTGDLRNIPPPLKQRCLQESLVVLGDHSSGRLARELASYYESLLGELELHAAIDGTDQVGSGKLFGMKLSIRYTSPLGRESDNFISIIGKDYSSGIEIDNKEILEEELRTKLSESFLIQEIRFHPPTTKARSYGKEGWLETPLAYLVLSAKDPAVDTIAPVQVDVMFRDGYGSVLLPITSRKILIDARDKEPPPRPLADVKVKQVLDARDLARGGMRLEVIASGTGLVPELDQLAEISKGGVISGFLVKDIEDHGVSVTDFTKGSEMHPISERTWFVSLESAKQQGIAVVDQFEFPKIQFENSTVSYEQFADADIVSVGNVVPLKTHLAYDPVQLAKQIAIGFASFSAVAMAGLWLWRRRRSGRDRESYSVPDKLTPFSLISFLRRISGDQRLTFAQADRESLRGTIEDLENRLFTSQNDLPGEGELRTVFDRWNIKTQQIYARHAQRKVG